ncbi:MAG: Gfo/Idh/MocA family oxidoreductase [Bryobacteraceae bacterium]
MNIAMLGSGFVAEFYMQGLQNVGGQEVVANYSRTPKRGREFAKRWEVGESTTNLAKLIARDDIDLYVIALPNQEHLPISLLLSAAGRNQVCTKPLARDGKEAKQMLGAAHRSGAMHGYAETEVFAPAVVKARAMVEAEASDGFCGCGRGVAQRSTQPSFLGCRADRRRRDE